MATPFDRIAGALDLLAKRSADHAALMRATGEIPDDALGDSLAEILFAQRTLAEALDDARFVLSEDFPATTARERAVFAEGVQTLSGLVVGFHLNALRHRGEEQPYCRLLDLAQRVYLGEQG